MAAPVAPAKKATPSADWRVIFLTDIGAPVTKANLFFLDLWSRFEGGMSHNNPLNTSLNTSHATGTWNSSGVKNYDTLANGAHAAAQTLLHTPAPGYARILQGFRQNQGPGQLATYVEVSPWDAGHYGSFKNGKYVGGSLLHAALGKNPGIGFGTVVGAITHSITHPGQSVDTTANAAKNLAEKPVKDTLHYILYGLAIAGGGALAVVGFILIAADIGLSKHGPRAVGGKALGSLGLGGNDEQRAYDEGERQARIANARRAGRRGQRVVPQREQDERDEEKRQDFSPGY